VPSQKGFGWKRLFVVAGVCAFLVIVFVFSLLFPAGIKPIEYTEPPDFATQDVEGIGADPGTSGSAEDHVGMSENAPAVNAEDADSRHTSGTGAVATDVDDLAMRIVLEGESPDLLVALMKSNDRDTRIAAALALAKAVDAGIALERNWVRKDRFSESVGADIGSVRTACYEALADSAEEGTYNWLPYVIAWMPGQDRQTLEMLAWAADNHNSAEMRRHAMYFAVNCDREGELATEVLDHRAHDPSLRVRMEALGLRFERLMKAFQ